MIDARTIWQVEEHVEDAFAEYLRTGLNDAGIFVGTSFTTAEYREPGVYVAASESDNVSETATFSGHRMLDVVVILRSAADPASDASLRTSREQHAQLKSRVMYLLSMDDLVTQINALLAGNFARIDMAEPGRFIRSVDPENNAFQTDITINCYARPTDE